MILLTRAFYPLATAVWARLPSNALRRFLLQFIARRYFVSVVGIAFEGDRVLLLRHTYDLQHPWGLPSGHVRLGESFQAALKREFQEEIGLQVEVGRLVTVVQEPSDRSFSVVFLCKVIGGTPRASYEVAEARYFPLDQLPAIRDVQIAAIIESRLFV